MRDRLVQQTQRIKVCQGKSIEMTQMPHTASPDDIDITALWRAVMDRKVSLLVSALGVGALTFFGLSLLTPQYTSTARLIIENDQTIYDRPTGQQGQRSDAGRLDKEAVISEVHVLRSKDLASDVIKKLQLKKSKEFNSALRTPGMLASIFGPSKTSEDERVLRAFTKKLTVYPIKDSRVIAVDMTSKDPVLSASAANALAEGYLDWQRGRQSTQTKGETESLRLQLEDLKKQVEAADFKLEKFRSETGLYSGQNNTTLNQQQLSEVNSQLSRAKAQKSEAEARARQVRTMLANGTVDSAPDVLRSQLIQRLLEQRVQVQRRISELSATLLPRHPRMLQVLSERAGITRQINSEVRKIVRGLENEARIAGVREASLRGSLDQVRDQASKTGNDQVRLTLLEREATSKRTLYDALLRKFDEASSASSSRNLPVYARIVEKARVTSIPSFPQKLPMSIFAAAATLLLGLAWVVTRALLNATRMEPLPTTGNGPGNGPGPGRGGQDYGSFGNGTASNGGPLPVGAAAVGLTAAGTSFGQNAPTVKAPASEAAPLGSRTSATSTMDIATTLLTRGSGKPGFRSIVTSVEKGRSALPFGMGLARQLAGAGARTIVISGERDATLAPQLQDAAGGLTDVLTGALSFKDAVRHDKASGVDMIEAGTAAFDWSDAGNGEQVNRLLDSLDGIYDQVLVVAEPGVGTEIFSLIEGRFDQGIVDGALPGNEVDHGVFLGFEIPQFHVATLLPPRRSGHSSIRQQFATAAVATPTN